MNTIEELTKAVSEKSKLYLEETGEKIETFPLSIVDFVIEYAMNKCHFPVNFTDDKKVTILLKHKNALAMACNEVYARSGAEGQTAHSENGIGRSYDSAWISTKLLSGLPNYAEIF